MRLEVTFNNGKFVGFPEVDEKSVKHDGQTLRFAFKGGHKALIMLSNVNFIEQMDD